MLFHIGEKRNSARALLNLHYSPSATPCYNGWLAELFTVCADAWRRCALQRLPRFLCKDDSKENAQKDTQPGAARAVNERPHHI
jgi:hypothetical protein